MKKKYLLSIIMLVAMSMPLMVACSSSSDDEDGGDVSYTESEIVELLTGTWYVSGEIKAVNKGKRTEGNYTGTIEFKANKSFKSSITSKCTRNDVHKEGEDDNEMIDDTIDLILDNDYKYSIVKKEGKNYIVFRCDIFDDNWYFEIVKLNKNSFMLALNQDVILKGEVLSHFYMSIVSN